MEVDNTSWKKKLTPQQKAEYKAEKREEMQNLFKKIDDGVKAVFESDSYKKCLRYMSKFTNYSAASAIYEYMLRNGSGTCVNRACQTYELCVDNGLDCCIVWTRAGLYGHVANIVRVEGIWYVLDTDGEFFLTYNNGFTEAVDIDGNHIADSDVISSKSYDELH